MCIRDRRLHRRDEDAGAQTGAHGRSLRCCLRRRSARRGEEPRQGARLQLPRREPRLGPAQPAAGAVASLQRQAEERRVDPGLPAVELDRARRLAVHLARGDPGGAALLRRAKARGRAPGDADHGRRRPHALGGERDADRRVGALPDPRLLPAYRGGTVPGRQRAGHRRGTARREDQRAPGTPHRLRSGRQHGGQEAAGLLLMAGSLPRAGMDMAAYVERYAGRDLLRFITCGSVDDGKSTLMGRLLYDAELLNDDSIAAVVADSGRWGTTGEAPDLALLVDGLQSEREQGITIDVAYRYFATDKRKFIMADTPGHEQYTRNMATGASTAELAVILIDARKGVLVQTRRHTAIVSMLGIRQLLVAVNKMDLVDFDEQRFNTIREDFQAVLDKLGNGHQVEFVPISALAGDNVVTPSQRTPWYTGPTLLSHLETVAVDKLAKGEDFRFPVQFVNRPSHDFRGYAGTVTAGAVQVGDEVMVLPSRTRSRVKSIISLGENPQRAEAPQAVTITLEDERDIARGDVLAHSNAAPTVTDTVDANVVWLHDRALEPGRLYDVKLATKSTQALVQRIDHRLDVNTFEKVPAEALALNEIGRCRLTFTSPVAVDLYQAFPVTGSFILIARLT